MQTIKSQEHSLNNYQEIEGLLNLLNRPDSSNEENKIILLELNYLLNYNLN